MRPKNGTTEIDGTFVDKVNFFNITMPIYNLVQYRENYSDTSGSLWGLKRDEITNNSNMTNNDSAPSVKYKANLIANTEANGTKKGVNSCTTKIFE